MKAIFKIQKHKSEGATLSVNGDLTVASSKEFKEYLVKLIKATGNGPAEISLREVEAIDITAFQLMYAALDAFMKDLPAGQAGGNRVTIKWPDNQPLNDLITKSGIDHSLMWATMPTGAMPFFGSPVVNRPMNSVLNETTIHNAQSLRPGTLRFCCFPTPQNPVAGNK